MADMIQTQKGVEINKEYLNEQGLQQAQQYFTSQTSPQQAGDFRIPTSPVITADSLKKTTPLSLPPAQPSSATAISAGSQALLKQLSDQEAAAQAKANSAENQLAETTQRILNIQGSRGDLEKEAGVPGYSENVKKFQNELDISIGRQNAEIQGLEQIGLTDIQKDQKAREINRRYGLEQANTSISLGVATRNLTQAQQSVNDKIKLELEPLQTVINFQEGVLTRNEGRLTTATQNKIQALLEQNKREYESEKDRLKTLEDTRLQIMVKASENGADQMTLSAIQRAETPEEAVSAAGSYLQSPVEVKTQIIEADGRRLLVDQSTGEVIADFGSSTSGFEVVEVGGRVVQVDKATGQVVRDLGAGKDNTKPPTEGQLKASTFSNRLMESNQIINRIGAGFTGTSSIIGQLLPNVLKSSERQQFEQAQRNFINAVLRRESGAVISEEEFDNARKQYFPQPGDSPEVLDQKRANRNTVIQGMLRESGNAAEYDPLNLENSDDPLGISFSQVGGGTDIATVKQIKDGSRVSTILGDGIATGIQAGSKFWKNGLDIVLTGGKGAAVKSPFEGTVVSAQNDGAWGNSVKIKTSDGRIIRLSHLDNIKVKPGQKIGAGTLVGGQGNTGRTYGKTGIHVDVTVYDKNGKPLTSQQVAALLGTRKA